MSSELKQAIIQELWPYLPAVQDNIEDFNAFFRVIQQERHPELARRHAIETFGDIIYIINFIRTNHTATFADIRCHLQSSKPQSSLAEASLSIELAVGIWLMSNARNLMPTHRYQLETLIPWPDTLSLRSVFDQQFSPRLDEINSQFSEHLNVSDMSRFAGFRISWTNNLTSHLTMKGSVIFVFHHVSVMRRMLKSVSNSWLVLRITTHGYPFIH